MMGKHSNKESDNIPSQKTSKTTQIPTALVKQNRYHIGKRFNNVYFTRIEAECMGNFLRAHDCDETARKLGLAYETVKFYLENMKKKLKCQTRCELISAIIDSDFFGNLDFKI